MGGHVMTAGQNQPGQVADLVLGALKGG
jgi:hypothetical protein